MQNTEGQERKRQQLRGKDKSTNQVMYKLEQVPKGVVQNQTKGKQGKKLIFIILNLQPEANQ